MKDDEEMKDDEDHAVKREEQRLKRKGTAGSCHADRTVDLQNTAPLLPQRRQKSWLQEDMHH